MTIPIKLRAADGVIRILVSHPSENGLRKGSDGNLVAAHFVKTINVTVNDKTLLDAQWGGGMTKDPYLRFNQGNLHSGDRVSVSVEDNTGDKGSAQGVVS